MKAKHPNSNSLSYVKENFNSEISYTVKKGNLSYVSFIDGSLAIYDEDIKIATIEHKSYLSGIKNLLQYEE